MKDEDTVYQYQTERKSPADKNKDQKHQASLILEELAL